MVTTTAIMGQNTSSIETNNNNINNFNNNSKSRRRPSARTLRQSFANRRRQSSGGGRLSHTFSVLEDTTDSGGHLTGLVNVNTATEEELMTLPGVDRQLAHNIVEHRRMIGRFRRVEDLVLVRGLGADRLLEKIASEVCVVNAKTSTSNTTSRTQSFDSLRTNSTDSKTTTPNTTNFSKSNNCVVNVNTANVFEIQALRGMPQEVAAAVVHYRDKKGPFKNLDDLLKVKNFGRYRLNSLRHQLTISTDENGSTPPPPATPNSNREHNISGHLVNGCQTKQIHKYKNGTVATPPSIQKNGFNISKSSILDIFELLSVYSPRPIIREIFNYQRNGVAAIRVATWNLHEFGAEKCGNFAVKEVVCRTILENRWSIVAVQDVLDVTALKEICQELNVPTLRRIMEWKSSTATNAHHWHYAHLPESKLAFLYDSYVTGDDRIELVSLDSHPDLGTLTNHCDIIIGNFRIGQMRKTFQFANVKLKNSFISNNTDQSGQNVEDTIQKWLNDDEFLMIFFDVSTLQFPPYNQIDLSFVPNEQQFPVNFTNNNNNNNSNKNNNNNMKCSSLQYNHNVLTSTKLVPQLTGFKGVVTKGLSHLGIPNGWQWGGIVSPFCPIWTELIVVECN